VIVPGNRIANLGIVAVAAALAVAFPPGAASQGAASKSSELRVFTTRAIATVLEKIGPDFERRTGRRLSVTTDVAIRMVRRINDGAPFDVLVAAPAQIDALITAGKILPETRVDLARSGIGVAVRAGAPKPDVSSVDAFKRALLAARSVAYLKEGQSGVYVAGVLERLGISETIRSKVTLPETDIVSELVSRGDIELGIVVITQILTTDGVALAGPLPSDIQSYITFTGGISADSSSFDAARELLTVLQSPAAIDVMRSQGMEPGRRLRN
jgi:molybdate transport system substrate-binding protein